MNHDQLWRAVLGELEINLSRVNFVTWFKDTFLSYFEGGKVIICVPNGFVKKWLEEKYHKNILNSLENISKEKINEIIYKIELQKNEKRDSSEIKNDSSEKVVNNNIVNVIEKTENNSKLGLNPRYLFDNFVVGKGNELAHAACRAVVNNLGKAYNPLFIYGGVGLGKTHLLQAVGNEAAKFTDKILYTTSEKFTNNYIQAVQGGKAKDFKNIYRNVDLLLIDDVQFMGGKDGTQEEFFHTFNELQQADKQIVMTSDRPPKSIPAIEKRLISRFESGMVADVGKPDIETKIAILEKNSLEKSFPLDKDVLIYIANNVQNNIRELEGALNKIIVIHQLNNSVPTLKSVKNALSDYVSDIQSKSMTAKDVIEVVARFYELSIKDIVGSSRKKELVKPRQVSIYLIREELGSSYPNIGQELGGRDHTTAMHAYNKVLKEIKENENEKLKQEIESIKQTLKNQPY